MAGSKLMISTFQTIITELGYSYNTTYATDISINRYQTVQSDSLDFLKSMAEFTEHIFYKRGTTYWLVDKLTGITPAATISEFVIDDEYVAQEEAPAGKYRAIYPYRYFDQSVYNLNETKSIVDSTDSTGTDAAPTVEINLFSMPIAKSGASVVYSMTDLNTVLSRKVSVYRKDGIILELDGIFDIQLGQSVSFSNKRASGSMVVTNTEHDPVGEITRITGIGSITFKEKIW